MSSPGALEVDTDLILWQMRQSVLAYWILDVTCDCCQQLQDNSLDVKNKTFGMLFRGSLDESCGFSF